MHRILFALLICVFMFVGTSAQDQDNVYTQGKITYERKLYLIKSLEDMGWANDWLDRMRDKLPKVVLTNFDLVFTPEKSYFDKSEVQDNSADKVPRWLQGYSSTNEVYTDIDAHKMVIKKTEMGKDFLIDDTFPDMQWKISDEFRTIAGYACRKATTIVQDSLFIIAFYTDAIYPSIGPEHFYGLPGTILGVAIPRLHVSYLATKVENTMINGDDIVQPKKGQKTTLEEFKNRLMEIGERFKEGMGVRMTWGIWI